MTGELDEPLPDDAAIDAAFAKDGILTPEDRDFYAIDRKDHRARRIGFVVAAVAGLVVVSYVGAWVYKLGQAGNDLKKSEQIHNQERQGDLSTTTTLDDCQQAEHDAVLGGMPVDSAMEQQVICETNSSTWGNFDPTQPTPNS